MRVTVGSMAGLTARTFSSRSSPMVPGARPAPRPVEFRIVERPIDEVALLSDGLQGLVLRYDDQSSHPRFFGPVFTAARHEPPGHSARLTAALAAFLNSDRVNQRTDDDKTLIV